MYQIKCDDYILLDHRDPDLIVTDPKVKLEVNTIGEGSFTIYNKHPFYNKLLKLKSVFEVRDEVGVIFRGRMTDDSHDFYNAKAVDLEGAMGYFNDSIVRPFKYPDDFSDNAEYNSSTNKVKFFLKWLIDNHNSQVKPFQQFKLGTVTVSDPNNYITRSSEKHDNTWNVLKSKLFDSELGGFLCIRYEEDGNYIDYLSEFTLTNTQDIVFGENLLDLKHDSDASETYSAIIPIGAEVEEETTDEETGETSTIKHTITIEDIADGNVNSDIVKKGDTLYSKSAVDSYGWIYAPVEKTTWTDVTLATNLLNKGVAYLSGDALMLIDSVELTAADLHFSDAEIRSFRIYRNVKARSPFHNLEGVYQLTKLEIPLLKPQDTKITVGNTRLTLTSQNAQNNADTIERIEIVEKDIEENRTNVDEIQQQLIIQGTTIINDAEKVILSAFKNYVEKYKGVSVNDVMVYYLASENSTGVTVNTEGWQTEVPRLTSAIPYLWTYEEVMYSDGSVIKTNPVNIATIGTSNITSIINYYATGNDDKKPVNIIETTNAETGEKETSEVDISWDTTIPVMSPSSTYLWHYKKITYANGTDAETEKVLLAAYDYSYEEFKDAVETQLQITSEDFSVRISKLQSDIDNVNGDLQEKFNKIVKYFTFDIDGLTIGQIDNPKKIVIDNDEISIMVNNVVVQGFDADGNALIPSLKVTEVLDMFGYTIDQDEEGNVNCEYTGG